MSENTKISPLPTRQEDFLRHFGVTKSFLTFHHFDSHVAKYLEIEMPYMILYESVDLRANQAICFEFTEGNRNRIIIPLEEMEHFKNQPLHSHDFYELTFVLSGNIQLQIEEEHIVFRQGECCLCNKNIHHKEYFDTDFEILLFLFQEKYIQSVLNENLFYDKDGNPFKRNTLLHQLFAKNKNSPFYHTKEYIHFTPKKSCDMDNVFRLVNNMILEIESDASGKTYMMKGYFCRFMAILEDEESYDARIHSARLSVQEALLYHLSLLLEEAKGNMTGKELEQHFHYRAEYISRIVKKRTGMTLSQYKRLFTLRAAAALLENTQMDIGTICQQTGYTNRSFFNRIFTKRYHMSPSEYRRRHRKNTSPLPPQG